jgi:hypothetical protein
VGKKNNWHLFEVLRQKEGVERHGAIKNKKVDLFKEMAQI